MCDCGQCDLVTDAASGDVVCRQCGVVVEAHIFDEHLEHYTDKAGPRAGPPDSWLLPAPPTMFGPLHQHHHHHRYATSNVDPHTSTREIFAVIEGMAHKFTADVQDTAKLLCRDLLAAKTVRADMRHLYAACALYLASKMHGNGIGRSKKEIAEEFASLGVTERGLTAIAKVFKDTLYGAQYATQLFRGLEAADLINRSVERLRLDHPMQRAVKKLAHDLMERLSPRETEGKNPCSICSGVVSCALAQLGMKMGKRRVAESCRVSSATLDKMSKAVAAMVAPSTPQA